jgi:hypothetical protein
MIQSQPKVRPFLCASRATARADVAPAPPAPCLYHIFISAQGRRANKNILIYSDWKNIEKMEEVNLQEMAAG